MSGIGLSGAHGSGKTTLAKAYAENTGIVFVPSEASSVIVGCGHNPALDYNFSDRLYLQKKILARAIISYEGTAGGDFITDRTPLDFLAYLMSDVGRNNVIGEETSEFLDYQRQCYEVLNMYFNVVVVVQPGINLVERDDKGSNNIAYMEHFNTLVVGLSVSSELNIQNTFIPRTCLNIDTRVQAVKESVKIAFNSFERVAARKGATIFSKSRH